MITRVEDIDLGTEAFWRQTDEEREAAFELLRRDAPVSFHTEPALPDLPAGPGFWAVTRHEDVVRVSKQPQLFCSGKGSNIRELPVNLDEHFGSLLNMDAPRHTRLRTIVQRAFTPREIARVEVSVRERARAIVARVAPLGACDFVSDIASPLPVEIICDMMGIPAEDTRRVYELSNVLVGIGDPDHGLTVADFMRTGLELYQYALELGRARLAQPREDLISAIMHAEVEGQRLTPSEFSSFFILLVLGGIESTRHAISYGVKALTDHPEQRRLWLEDFAGRTPGAVEEIVRWTSPFAHFRRTATADTELAGVPIRAGDKVSLWFKSANRDERVFSRPYEFDILRSPNHQVAFGAGGPHFCLGASLARREIAVMFDELLHRLPDIEVCGPAVTLFPWFINGIKRMPCRFSPRELSLD